MYKGIVLLVSLGVACSAIAASCDDEAGSTPSPGGSWSAVRIEDAPIDDLEVLVLESFPVQYNLRIVSGLPSGCAVFDKAEVTGRSGNEVTVRVTNTLPDDPNVACTAIYGTKETTLALGTDFVSGMTYTVNVNGDTIGFTAQ